VGKEFYEIIFIVQSVSLRFAEVRNFLQQTRSHYTREQLPEVLLFSWIGGNSLGVLLRFHFADFLPSRLKWFDHWINELALEVIELEKFGKQEKAPVLEKFNLTSDVKFSGNYDLEHALDEIERRIGQLHGVRKKPRVAERIEIQFKTAEDFVREYTENISQGGMFIRGLTDLPLGARIELVMKLPGQEGEVKALAEIVHVLDQAKVSLVNGKSSPGSGVQFIQFMGDGETRLRSYLQKAGRGKSTE